MLNHITLTRSDPPVSYQLLLTTPGIPGIPALFHLGKSSSSEAVGTRLRSYRRYAKGGLLRGHRAVESVDFSTACGVGVWVFASAARLQVNLHHHQRYSSIAYVLACRTLV